MPTAPDRKRRNQREWYARRRAEWLADKVCLRCGATTDLQLDHRDPQTKVSHNIWSWSQARRDAELAKCQVLCESCHRWKTAGCQEFASGERNGSARLTAERVDRIRRLYATGEVTQRELARYFGVGRSTVQHVLAGNTWSR